MDENDANVMFASANVEKVTKFTMNGGEVDFGDDLHLVGRPLGTAIVAWSSDGRVGVRGRLFSDNFRDPQTAIVEIRFKRRDGHIPNLTTRSLATQGGPVGSKLVNKVSPTGRFDEVRIRLKQFLPDSGLAPTTTTLKTRTFKR